ncbi:MAG: hypothetical protein K9M81_00655 [Chthoniobacterales bacterium]|nr:hypothetical protein [Chthoniobacterales bacterium]
MDAALDSHFDLDSMYTYSPASKCSSALPHQPSRSPRYDQYEISGLCPHLLKLRPIPLSNSCNSTGTTRLFINFYKDS